MGAQCCRRRADDDDDHDEVVSPCLADADADGHADDVDDHDEVVSPCSPGVSSPHLAPAPAWGRSFMMGQELRRKARVDSRSMELPPEQ